MRLELILNGYILIPRPINFQWVCHSGSYHVNKLHAVISKVPVILLLAILVQILTVEQLLLQIPRNPRSFRTRNKRMYNYQCMGSYNYSALCHLQPGELEFVYFVQVAIQS